MDTHESAKDILLDYISAHATKCYDLIEQDMGDVEDESRTLVKLEQIYQFYENDGNATNLGGAYPITTRRSMARWALLISGVYEDAQQAVDLIRQATTHTEAEIHLAVGDLDSIGLVTIK